MPSKSRLELNKNVGLCYVSPRMHSFWNQRPGRVGQTSEHEIPLLETVGVLEEGGVATSPDCHGGDKAGCAVRPRH